MFAVTTVPTEGHDGDAEVATGTEILEDLVARQQHEIEHLLRAMRHRAVIEQAKGVLTGWLGVEPDEAFRHLVRVSQHSNRPLSHAAAAVVARAAARDVDGAAFPDLPDDDRLFEGLDPGELLERLATAAVEAAPDLERLLGELRTALGELAPAGLLLGAVEPDGAVRILAARGYPLEVLAGWERIPPRADVPVADAATGEAVFTATAAERLARYPGSRRVLDRYEGTAALPVRLGDRLVGVLAVSWSRPVALDAAARRRLVELADRCAVPLADHLARLDPAELALPPVAADPARARWLQVALGEVAAPVALLDPVVTADGTLVDLRLVFANADAAAHLDGVIRPLGRSVVELAPWLPSSPLFAAFDEVVRHGEPRRLARVEVERDAEDPRPNLALHQVGAARVGTLLLCSWRRTERTD